MNAAAYASAPLSMASLRLRRLPDRGKPKPEAQNLGVDKHHSSPWQKSGRAIKQVEAEVFRP